MALARALTLAAAAVAIFAGAGTGRAVVSRTTPFTVASSLSDVHVFPHRIHWLGKPSLPPAKVREVDFLIDGRRAWVEHHAPYSYGYDGNYLVTTWMKPGPHSFTVVAVATDGRRATIASRAQTAAPKPPPSALAGSWRRRISPAEAGGSGLPGTWTLTVTAVGWRFVGPTRRRGALVDVAYPSSHVIEARGGIATRNHDPRENNPWCDEPFQPLRYAWHAAGDRLVLTLKGPKRCDGQSRVWAGEWTRRSNQRRTR